MTGWNSFGRSVLFAATAAAGWLPWAFVVGPITGGWTARTLYLIGATAVYVAGLAAQAARGAMLAVGAAAAGGAVAVIAATGSELFAGLALVLAIVRSVFLYRSAAARAVLTETVVFLASIWFVRWLGVHTLFMASLSVWGFFLAQSCFFLLGGARPHGPVESAVDPFDAAHRRATELLERARV